MENRIRKEVWLDPDTAQKLKAKAKISKRSTKGYIENLIVEDLRGRKEYSIYILRRYYNEITREDLPTEYYRDELQPIMEMIEKKLRESELNKKRWPDKSVRLLEFIICANNGELSNLNSIILRPQDLEVGELWEGSISIPHY